MNDQSKILQQYTRLKNKQWYHQRFDGCPYLIHFIAEPQIRTDKKKKRGGHFTLHVCFFENDRADWYMLKEDMIRIAKKYLTHLKQDPELGIKLLQAWKPQEEAFENICKKVEETDLTSLSDHELRVLHHTYVQVAFSRFSSSSIIDGFALGTDELIYDKISAHLKRIGRVKEARSLISELTAPVHQSFINNAEVELYRIARWAQEHNEDLTKPNKTLQKQLDNHAKKFFWINNNYVHNYILTSKHFLQEVCSAMKHHDNLTAQINRIINTPLKHRKRKEILKNELALPKELMSLIRISEDLTYWQDERKKATYLNAHYASLLLEEIGRRKKYSLEELKYLLPAEIDRLFDEAFNHKEIRKRRRQCVVYWDEQEDHIYTQPTYNTINKLVRPLKNYSEIKEFAGLSASLGIAKGTVRVVRSATEIHKVKKGDILVAIMTRPDYIAGMKKAAAIITEEGGITCHAAIVSRELGIPCVIGTKIATKVLKDGDVVEVNADTGHVKKV